MKISNSPAKYRCPACKEVYKYTATKQALGRVTGVFTGAFQTVKDAKNNIKYKYNTTKNTYNYMKSVKKNMKKDPNWSNYRKEQEEMKDISSKPSKFKDMFNKFKKK